MTEPGITVRPGLPGVVWAATELPAAEPAWARLVAAEATYGRALPGAKRRREWFAGRLAARAVLRALDHAEHPLLPDDEGAPVITGADPAALELSLTHGGSWAIAAGQRRGPETPHLGIDLVDDADAARAARVLGRHTTPRERQLLAAHPEAAGLLWGAREAVAKATRTGMFAFALLDVHVEALDLSGQTLDVDFPGCTLSFERWVPGATLIRALVRPDAAARAQAAAARRRGGAH